MRDLSFRLLEISLGRRLLLLLGSGLLNRHGLLVESLGLLDELALAVGALDVRGGRVIKVDHHAELAVAAVAVELALGHSDRSGRLHFVIR